MESLFLFPTVLVFVLVVLLSSFTPVTLDRIQPPTDEQILAVTDGHQPQSFTLLAPQDKAGNQVPIQHFWHWIQHQEEYKKTWTDKDKPKKRHRRKEVANGEDTDESGEEQQFKNMSNIIRFHHNHKNTSGGHHQHSNQSHNESHGIHVASWRWEEVGVLFTFTSFIVVAGLAKVGKLNHPQRFHVSYRLEF